MKPKISIIVPVYNAENYLEKCIDSVLNQTFRDFELILVNDGSLDSSGAICDEYSQKDKRIIVIHKKNGGQSSARNAGLDIVKGEYIGFVDSDDWIEPEMYEILYNNIFETHSDISICKTRLVKQNSKEEKIECSNKKYIFEGKEIYDKVFINNIFEWGPCNKLYKFSKIFNIRFLEGRVYEDVVYNLFVYKNVNKISYIDNFLYNYRVDNLSTTRQEVSVKRLDLVKNILDNYEVLPSKYQTQFLESIYPIVYKII
ncbi:MAG: glycosyltransferase family 2 protein, partial [Cetobacterium sp.]